eukprot:TRINITY_DN45819_c0_g1_i1.p1 TRINITY_DN45819_c0_g1~~TRINITY_DN45819_c0_g1_i1.p1  ORF type:complete len:105 (+),score=3.19 TRINITY_DN45819_c0_g1_i1:162-476(+)
MTWKSNNKIFPNNIYLFLFRSFLLNSFHGYNNISKFFLETALTPINNYFSSSFLCRIIRTPCKKVLALCQVPERVYITYQNRKASIFLFLFARLAHWSGVILLT